MSSTTIYCATCGAANPLDAAQCFACGNPPQGDALREFSPAVAAPGAAPTALLPSNQLLKQRYRLLRQVGKGGFGAVYQAQDIQLGSRLVAVKEMSQRGLTPEELREATGNFQREALLLASLHHPNLPHIYEQFEEGGRWYLVMEFIEGETLEARLGRVPAGLPIEETLQIGLQLSKALGYLHSRQPPIIFRDLKPANIMLTPEGQVYLIDFGIARLFKPGQTKDTEAFGSAGYAAPEQYGKAQTTAQSDIYGLGATLYHLLSGDDPTNHPFLFKPLHLPAAPALAKLVMWMLEQDQTQRPADMQIVSQKLQQIANAYAAEKKHSNIPIVIHSPHQPEPPKSAQLLPMPSKAAAARPNTFNSFDQGIARTSFKSSRREMIGFLSIGSAVIMLLVGAILTWALSFHQEVKTSTIVSQIAVGSGFDSVSQTVEDEKSSFNVGDTVYMVFTVNSSANTTSDLSAASVNLFRGNTQKVSHVIRTGITSVSDLVNNVLNNGSGSTVVGDIVLSDQATVTQSGIYKWEITDTFGNFWASITFQVN